MRFYQALNRSAITNVNNLDGSYAGMLFNSNEPAGSRILPAAMTCTTGNCAGNLVDDIDAGALSLDSVTVDLSGGVDTPSNRCRVDQARSVCRHPPNVPAGTH